MKNTLKVSKKMQSAIDRLENKFGKLEKKFGVEFYECNRVGRGFYDYCELHCPILSRTWIVNHDGETF